MVSAGIVSILAGQLLRAKVRAAEVRSVGKDARAIEGIVRSLRRTLAGRIQFRDLRELAVRGFSLGVTPGGDVVVRHEDRVLPVSDLLVRVLFQEAGVELVPGQVLLLDGDIARILVEEALEVLTRNGFTLDDRTGRLARAARALGALDGEARPKAMGSSPGAA